MNILKNALSEAEAIWYQQHYPKHTVTRELHDCYIIARYSRYDKLNKKSGNIIKDVEDKA